MISIVELDERINKCLSVLQENPRSRIFAALAEAYRRRGDVGRAFSVCKNGLRVHPDYGAAYVVVAKLYLHQNMIAQAHEAIGRAIELDGASRSTDLVLVEIDIEAGEFAHARNILDRLDQTGGHDPAVQSLRAQLRERTRQAGRQPIPSPPPGRSRREFKTIEPPAMEEPPPSPAETSCDSPATAVEHILHVPRTLLSAVWDDEGNLLAARAAQPREIAPLVSEIGTLFALIEKQMLGHGWGRLALVRIEETQGQWGLVREGKMAALVLGTPQVPFRAAMHKAIDCLSQLHASGSVGPPPEPDQAEFSPE